MCPNPPPHSSPTEHERRGHKAGSGKQNPAGPAPGEGGQAPPAAGQVSPLVLFFLGGKVEEETRSLFPPSPRNSSLFPFSESLHSTSPPSPLYPFFSVFPPPHISTRLSSAVLDSTVWQLSACCCTLLRQASPPWENLNVNMHALISQPNKEDPVNDCCAHTWVSSVSCGVVLLMWAADQSSVLIVWVPREGPFWPMTLKPTQHHSGLWATIPNELHGPPTAALAALHSQKCTARKTITQRSVNI